MNIQIWTRIYPSEDEKKVIEALENLFPAFVFERTGDRFEAAGSTFSELRELKERIDDSAIRDTARRVMGKGTHEKAVTFHLNKQAAYAGKVNFSKDSPLGPITVRIVGNPEMTLDYLAPSTLV